MDRSDEVCLHNFLECLSAQVLTGDFPETKAVAADSHKALLWSDKGSSDKVTVHRRFPLEVICILFWWVNGPSTISQQPVLFPHTCSHCSPSFSKTPDHDTPFLKNTPVAFHCQGLGFIILDLPFAY